MNHSLDLFDFALQRAISHAINGNCSKSRRGVAIWRPRGSLLSVACNRRADGLRCDGSAACRRDCKQICTHAEEVALHAAGVSVKGAELLHIEMVLQDDIPSDIEPGKQIIIDDWTGVPSGPPSCVECSKMILEAGIAGVHLFHADGWRRYTAVEFHQATLQALRLYAESKPTLPVLTSPDVSC